MRDSLLFRLLSSVVIRLAEPLLPKGVLRPEGVSIGGIGDELRTEAYTMHGLGREMEHERAKLTVTFARPDLPRRLDEVQVAQAYELPDYPWRERLAAAGARDDLVRFNIEAARSARYFSDGILGGVVDHVGPDRGRPNIVFTNNQQVMTGSIWAAVLSRRLEDVDATFGDWGLPSMTLHLSGDQGRPGSQRSSAKIMAPALPHGDSIDDNIRQTIIDLKLAAFFLRDPDVLTGKTLPLRKLIWFAQKVNNRGPWDYKTADPDHTKYEYAGNFNYGATGAALGVSLEALLRIAGWKQIADHNSRPEYGDPNGSPPFGDAPSDQEAIKDGFEYYRQHETEWNRLKFGPDDRRH